MHQNGPKINGMFVFMVKDQGWGTFNEELVEEIEDGEERLSGQQMEGDTLA